MIKTNMTSETDCDMYIIDVRSKGPGKRIVINADKQSRLKESSHGSVILQEVLQDSGDKTCGELGVTIGRILDGYKKDLNRISPERCNRTDVSCTSKKKPLPNKNQSTADAIKSKEESKTKSQQIPKKIGSSRPCTGKDIGMFIVKRPEPYPLNSMRKKNTCESHDDRNDDMWQQDELDCVISVENCHRKINLYPSDMSTQNTYSAPGTCERPLDLSIKPLNLTLNKPVDVLGIPSHSYDKGAQFTSHANLQNIGYVNEFERNEVDIVLDQASLIGDRFKTSTLVFEENGNIDIYCYLEDFSSFADQESVMDEETIRQSNMCLLSDTICSTVVSCIPNLEDLCVTSKVKPPSEPKKSPFANIGSVPSDRQASVSALMKHAPTDMTIPRNRGPNLVPMDDTYAIPNIPDLLNLDMVKEDGSVKLNETDQVKDKLKNKLRNRKK